MVVCGYVAGLVVVVCGCEILEWPATAGLAAWGLPLPVHSFSLSQLLPAGAEVSVV